MSAELALGIASIFVIIIGALITVLINVFVALQKNTSATDRLVDAMDKQDLRLDGLERNISDHAARIGNIETMHRIKGCDRRNPE